MAIECLNALLAQSSCFEGEILNTMKKFLTVHILGALSLISKTVKNVTLVEQIYCRYNQETQGDLWSQDACCNVNRKVEIIQNRISIMPLL
jgi:hypothetical protein